MEPQALEAISHIIRNRRSIKPVDMDPARTVDQLVEAVVGGVLVAGDSCIVLCHTWPRPTAAAMARIIPRLRDAGVEFVRVDALPAVLAVAVAAVAVVDAAPAAAAEDA